jgi:hypothetical protein
MVEVQARILKGLDCRNVALGQKRTLKRFHPMSAFTPKSGHWTSVAKKSGLTQCSRQQGRRSP